MKLEKYGREDVPGIAPKSTGYGSVVSDNHFITKLIHTSFRITPPRGYQSYTCGVVLFTNTD